MTWIVLGAFVFTFVGAVIYAVGLYNALINLKHAVDRSWANIDVLLKQRHDELPKLVNTVKGYMQHERETLSAVTDARSRAMGAGSVGDKIKAEGELGGALPAVLVERAWRGEAPRLFRHLAEVARRRDTAARHSIRSAT